jgi:hypothetical protein
MIRRIAKDEHDGKSRVTSRLGMPSTSRPCGPALPRTCAHKPGS